LPDAQSQDRPHVPGHAPGQTSGNTPGNTPGVPGLKPLVVSAPFGNYIQPAGATPTLGTFTLHRRPGRLWQVIRTVRYRRGIKAWVNRIGLRNPGIDWLADRAARGRTAVSDKIVSIHGFDGDQWAALLDRVGRIRPLAVELNMSCPNVGEIDWPPELFSRALDSGVPVIVKLPPVNYEQMAEQAVSAGVRAFHCCNTLPVPEGGMSGRPLQPVALKCIRDLRGKPFGAELTIIGGGGVYELSDIDIYADAGADHVALGTKTMNPVHLLSHRGLRPFVEKAAQRLPCGDD
jgi:dihydroorotate dehydrogenase